MSDLYYDDIKSIVEALGFMLVEYERQALPDQMAYYIVIHHPEGVKIDDCANINRLAQSRLEVLEDSEDVRVEVSSPGINRRFCSPREYDIFKGKKIKVLLEEESEWHSGILQGMQDSNVILEGDEKLIVPLEKIKKARLSE